MSIEPLYRTSPRILLIDGGSSTTRCLTRLLQSRGYVCDNCDIVAEGLDFSRLSEYQLVVLDLLSPAIDARDVLRRLRKSGLKPPILTLVGTDDPADDMDLQSDHGAALLNVCEGRSNLTAQIENILQTARGPNRGIIENGKLRVNLATRTVEADGRPLRLTGKEYGILELLLRRKGAPVSKEMFLDYLYGGKARPGGKIVDVYVCKIRKKIGKATGDDDCIETVWGGGYVLRNYCEEKLAG
jgi:two-component system cell cycle response regulator CtrA